MNSKKKSNAISDQIRQKGNKSFAKGDYFDALTMYNEALRYAESNSKQLGLSFGNRSAAFLQVKQYKACLQNIELAIKNQLPDYILPKLNEREIECKKLMEESQTPLEETWNDFFKLSYEPNPKLPFLSNCLVLKTYDQGPRQGLFLTTNRDLKAGDIIGITEPFVRFPIDTSSYRCNYCLADKFMNFIPCSGCTEVMFCNEHCMQKALTEFHQFECGIHDNPEIPIGWIYVLRMIMKCVSLFGGSRKEMEKFLAPNKKKLITPFDFDFSDPSSLLYEKNLMLTQLCENQQFNKTELNFNAAFQQVYPFLKRHPNLREIVTPKLFTHAAYYTLGDAKRFKSIEAKVLSTQHQNGGQFTINYYGDAIDICFNLIRYSCAPNVILHPYNGRIIWIVHYPIKSNDWLTVAFNNTVFFEKSLSERLKGDIGHIVANCQCPACFGYWDPVFAAYAVPINLMRHSSEDAIKQFEELCNEINNSSNPLVGKCDENVWFAISRFRWNVISIGKASFWTKIPPMDFRQFANFNQLKDTFKSMGLADDDWMRK